MVFHQSDVARSTTTVWKRPIDDRVEDNRDDASPDLTLWWRKVEQVQPMWIAISTPTVRTRCILTIGKHCEKKVWMYVQWPRLSKYRRIWIFLFSALSFVWTFFASFLPQISDNICVNISVNKCLKKKFCPCGHCKIHDTAV